MEKTYFLVDREVGVVLKYGTKEFIYSENLRFINSIRIAENCKDCEPKFKKDLKSMREGLIVLSSNDNEECLNLIHRSGYVKEFMKKNKGVDC